MRHIGTIVTIALILFVMAAQTTMLRSVHELNLLTIQESGDIAKLQVQMLHMNTERERSVMGLKPLAEQEHTALELKPFKNPDVFLGGHAKMKHLPLNHSVVAKEN